MDPAFWLSRWQENRIGFHKSSVNPNLLAHFPQLAPKEGHRILVPLCGKSVDLLWLRDRGFHVTGIELSEKAVRAFYEESALGATASTTGPFKTFTSGRLSILCGDLFLFEEKETYDIVYDRASLIALPPTMRTEYGQVIARALRPGGRYLLITLDYDPAKMDGPPFSIPESNVRELFGDAFEVVVLARQSLPTDDKLGAIEGLKETAFLLTKRA